MNNKTTWSEETLKLKILQDTTHEILQEMVNSFKGVEESTSIIMNLSNISRDLNKMILKSINKEELDEKIQD